MSCNLIVFTYPLSEVLDQHADGLNVFRLIGVLHHQSHMLFHLRKVGLGC